MTMLCEIHGCLAQTYDGTTCRIHGLELQLEDALHAQGKAETDRDRWKALALGQGK